jgi:hypothetical protein
MALSNFEQLFSDAMSYGAVFGSVMPMDAWDTERERKAREYAAKACALEVTEDRMRGNDSMFGVLGEMG